MHGFEMHLARMHRDVQLFAPSIAVVDPISAFRGPPQEVHATLLRMVDMLKGSGITALFTSLRAICPSGDDGTETGLSSLMDSWIRLTDVDSGGERNRVMCIVKSRGTSHSSQMREYVITDAGIRIVDSYTGPNGVLTGTARLAQEARERGEAEAHIREVNRRGRENAYQRRTLEGRIAELQAELDANLQDDEIMLTEDAVHTATLRDELLERTQSREGAD
jgi:circadian clock protein KaiC